MDFSARVITLDPDGERFRRFSAANAHLHCRIMRGVRGSAISPEERISQGLITLDCAASGLVTDGEIGAAVSHRILWSECVETRAPILVLEDDVTTHPELARFIGHTVLPPDLDILFFGLNTDSIFHGVSPQGVQQLVTYADKYPSQDRIRFMLRNTRPSDVAFWRLLNCFGMCCYLITPAGAAKMLNSVLPLRLQGAPIPGLNGIMPGKSIDRRLNALYARMNAYVCVPFLAWTPNDDSSTR